MNDLIKGETIPYGKHKYTFDRYEGDAVILKDPNSNTLYRVSKIQFQKSLKNKDFFIDSRAVAGVFTEVGNLSYNESCNQHMIWAPISNHGKYAIIRQFRKNDRIIHIKARPGSPSSIVAISKVDSDPMLLTNPYQDPDLLRRYGECGIGVKIKKTTIEPIALKEHYHKLANYDCIKYDTFTAKGSLKIGGFLGTLSLTQYDAIATMLAAQKIYI